MYNYNNSFSSVWWFGLVVTHIRLINKVKLDRDWLVTAQCESFTSVCNQTPRSTQPGHPSVGNHNDMVCVCVVAGKTL